VRVLLIGDRSARRGSLWGGGAGALLPAVNQPVKDPRPLRDRQYQTKMRQELVSWLQSANYDISMHILANITAKEYRNIFQYLYSMLDQDYPFDSQARFEDEFITALKCVRYPFVGQVDPKWLAAPASMHSWPSLMGVLHWLTVICKVRHEGFLSFRAVPYCSSLQARLHYLESEHPTLQDPDLVPEEFDDPNYHAALAFVYYSEAYEDFFAGSDNYEVHEQRLEERYGEFLVHLTGVTVLSCDSQEERAYCRQFGRTEGSACESEGRVRATTVRSRTHMLRTSHNHH